MLFNSYIFVLFFMPLCIVGYFELNKLKLNTLAQLFLLCMSLWFYGYYNPQYVLIILVSVGINYSIYKMLLCESTRAPKKMTLIIGVVINLGILAYFKYMDFFIETANYLFKTDRELLGIALPLGISFFTFQQISFIVDSYKGEIKDYSFLDYACFVTFFPQLIAGPIVTHDELVPQFKDETKKSVDWDNLSKGLFLFAIGLGKKVLLADTFGNAVNIGYLDVNALDTTNALIVMLGYTFQMYFDFSGYADMAIGLGKMLNIDLPQNFDSPYKAKTIPEHWSRWHMTLQRFFTKYVYIPLGGSRKGVFRTYLNIFIVFFLSGFWHGAGFTYIIWGMGHGIMSIITRASKKVVDKVPDIINWAITFAFINVGFIFFRAPSVGVALDMIKRILGLNFGPVLYDIRNAFMLPGFECFFEEMVFVTNHPSIFMIGFFVIAFVIIFGCKNAYQMTKEYKPTVFNMLLTSGLLVWCIFSFAGVSTFLYFNF